MSPILATILVLGAVLTLATFTIAIRAGVSAFAAQARLRRELASEVERLARRSGELQTRTARLERSTQDLPANVSHIQENLAELRVLSGNLYVTLSRARRMLSYSGIKSSGTSWLSTTARRYARHTQSGRRARG